MYRNTEFNGEPKKVFQFLCEDGIEKASLEKLNKDLEYSILDCNPLC